MAYYCGQCNKNIKTRRGLEEHLRQSANHSATNGRDPTVERHCAPGCGSSFAAEANLDAHRRSDVHREKDVPCVFGPPCKLECKKRFVSLAAMVLHLDLESSTCVSGVDSSSLHAFVCRNDTEGRFITKGASTDTVAVESQRKMYICRSSGCNGTFTMLGGLAQHLESPKCEHDGEMLSEMHEMLVRFAKSRIEARSV